MKYPTEKGEIWVNLRGWEGSYQISNFGRTRSLPRKGRKLGKVMGYQKAKNFYYLQLSKMREGEIVKKECLVIHRAIAVAFVPNPEKKKLVRHKDGNTDNNRADNLEWYCRTEMIRKKRTYQSAKLSKEEVLEIAKLLKNKISVRKIAKKYGMKYSAIHCIKTGKHWGWLTGLQKSPQETERQKQQQKQIEELEIQASKLQDSMNGKSGFELECKTQDLQRLKNKLKKWKQNQQNP